MRRMISASLCLVFIFVCFTACGQEKSVLIDENKPVKKVSTETVAKTSEKLDLKIPEKAIKTNLDTCYDAFEYIIRHSKLNDVGLFDVPQDVQRQALKIISPALSEKEKYRFNKTLEIGYGVGITDDVMTKISDERGYKISSDKGALYKYVLDWLSQREKENKKLTFEDCTDVLIYLLRKGDDLDVIWDDSSAGLFALRNTPIEFKYRLDDKYEIYK